MTGVRYATAQGTDITSQSVTCDALGRVITLSETRPTSTYNSRSELTADQHHHRHTQLQTLYWDPTEPDATRPLVMLRPKDNEQNGYEYTHTLNKNVCHLTDKTGSLVAHYDYDAYGNINTQTGILASKNPICFSSEYDDDDLGLVYYNYRHYNPKDGRWINRDPIGESGGNNLYGFVQNKLIYDLDILGLNQQRQDPNTRTTETPKALLEKMVEVGHKLNKLTREGGGKKEYSVRICKKSNGEYYHASISEGDEKACSGHITRPCNPGDKDAAIVHSNTPNNALDISNADRRTAKEGWPPPQSKGSEHKLDKNLPIGTVFSSKKDTQKPLMLIYQPNEYYDNSKNIRQGKYYKHNGTYSEKGKYSLNDGRRFNMTESYFV